MHKISICPLVRVMVLEKIVILASMSILGIMDLKIIGWKGNPT